MRKSRRTGLMSRRLIYSVGNCCKPQAQHQRRKKVRVRRNRSSSKLGRVKRKKAEMQTLSSRLSATERNAEALFQRIAIQRASAEAFADAHPETQTLRRGNKGPIGCFSPLRASPHYTAPAHSAPPWQPQQSITLIKTLFNQPGQG